MARQKQDFLKHIVSEAEESSREGAGYPYESYKKLSKGKDVGGPIRGSADPTMKHDILPNVIVKDKRKRRMAKA